MVCCEFFFLSCVSDNNLEIYKLKGSFLVKVVDVYDGDTITIILINKCGYEKHKLRMYGYDSPEIKPLKNKKNRDTEIKNALKAKNFLSKQILNKIVIFESKGYDKYGRLLGNIYLRRYFKTNININQLMIEKGFGYPYFGGTKKIIF